MNSWVPLTGTIVVLFIAIITLFFKAGHLSARVEELERWRPDIRRDMHEISDSLEIMKVSVNEVKTLILERTERRRFPRKENTES